jgi:hypothetical protein
MSDRETDENRIADLARAHDLIFRRKGSSYVFKDFTAHGYRQALGYVEGFAAAANDAVALKSEMPGKTVYRLIVAEDPYDIKVYEAIYGMSQTEAVDHLIEKSCWRDDMPKFVGGKGTPQDRLTALRAAFKAQLG